MAQRSKLKSKSGKESKHTRYSYDPAPLINQNFITRRNIEWEIHGSPSDIIKIQEEPVTFSVKPTTDGNVRVLEVGISNMWNTTDFTYLMVCDGRESDFLNTKEYTDVYLDRDGNIKKRVTKCFAVLSKTSFGAKESDKERTIQFDCNTDYYNRKIMEMEEIQQTMEACREYVTKYGSLHLFDKHHIRGPRDYVMKIIDIANLLNIEDVQREHREVSEVGKDGTFFIVSTDSNRAFFNLLNMLYDTEKRLYMNKAWPKGGDKKRSQTHEYGLMKKALDFIQYVQSLNGTSNTISFRMVPVKNPSMNLKDYVMKNDIKSDWNLGMKLHFSYVNEKK